MFKRVEKAVARSLSRTPDESKSEKVPGTPDGKSHRFWGARAPSPGPLVRAEDGNSLIRPASQPRARPESSPAGRPEKSLSNTPSLDLTKLADAATSSPGVRPPVSASPASTFLGKLRTRSYTDKREAVAAQSVTDDAKSGPTKGSMTIDKADRPPGMPSIPPREGTKLPKSPYTPGTTCHDDASAVPGSGVHVTVTPPATSPSPLSPSHIKAEFFADSMPQGASPVPHPARTPPPARGPATKPSISTVAEAASLASPVASESPLIPARHYGIRHPPFPSPSTSSLSSPGSASFTQLEVAVAAVRKALPGSAPQAGAHPERGRSAAKAAPHATTSSSPGKSFQPSSSPELAKSLDVLAALLQGHPVLHEDLLKSTNTSQTLLDCFHEYLIAADVASAINSASTGVITDGRRLAGPLAAVLDGLMALSGSAAGRTLLVADARVVADVLALAQGNLAHLLLCEQVARIAYQLACFRALHVSPALEGSLVPLACMSLGHADGSRLCTSGSSSVGTPAGGGISCSPSHYADSPVGALSPLSSTARCQARCTRAYSWAALLHLLDRCGRSGLKIAVEAGGHRPFLEVIVGLHGRDRECGCDWCVPGDLPLTLPSSSTPLAHKPVGTPNGTPGGGNHSAASMGTGPVILNTPWDGPGPAPCSEDEDVEASLTLRNALLIVLRGCSLAVAGPSVTGSSVMTSSSASGGLSGPLLDTDRSWALRVQEAVVASGAVPSLLRLVQEARDSAEACATSGRLDVTDAVSGGKFAPAVDPLGDCQGLALQLVHVLADSGEEAVCRPIVEGPGGALHTLLTCLDAMVRWQGGMGPDQGDGPGGDLVAGGGVAGAADDGMVSPRRGIGSSCWQLLRVLHNLVRAAPKESCKQLLSGDARDFTLLCELAAAKETAGAACAHFASILASLSAYLQDANGSSNVAWLWLKAGVLGSLESLSRKLQDGDAWHTPKSGELVHRHLARVYAALAGTPDGAAALSTDTLVETLYDWLSFSPDPRICCYATAILASLARHAAAGINPAPSIGGPNCATPFSGTAHSTASFNARARDERAKWLHALLSPPLLPAMLALVEASLDPSGTLAGVLGGGSVPCSPTEGAGGQPHWGLFTGGLGSPKEQERLLRREKYARMVRQLRREPARSGAPGGGKGGKPTRGKGGDGGGRGGAVASVMQMHNTPLTPRASDSDGDDLGYGSEGDHLMAHASPLLHPNALPGAGGGSSSSGGEGAQAVAIPSRLGVPPPLDTGSLSATGAPWVPGDRRFSVGADAREFSSPRSETEPSEDSLPNSHSYQGELGTNQSASYASAAPSPQVTVFHFPPPAAPVNAASVDAMYNMQAVGGVFECLAALRESPALFRGPSDGGTGTGVAVVDDQRRQEERVALLVSCVLSLEWERELSAAALPLAEAVSRGHLALAQLLCTEQAMATLALHVGAGREGDLRHRHGEEDSPRASHLLEQPPVLDRGLTDPRRSAAQTLLQLLDQPETCSEALDVLRRCPALTRELLRSTVTAYSALEGGPGGDALLLRLLTALSRDPRLVPALAANGILSAVAMHPPAETSEGSGVLEPPAPQPGAWVPRSSSGATWGQPYLANEARLYAHVIEGAGELLDITLLAPLEVAGRLSTILKCADHVKPPHASVSTTEAALRAAGALAERPGCKPGLVAGGVMEHLPRLMLQANPPSPAIPQMAERCLRRLLGVPEPATLGGVEEDLRAGRENDAASNEALAAFGRLAVKDSQALGWPLRPQRFVCKAFATLASHSMMSRLLAALTPQGGTTSLTPDGLAPVCTSLVKADPTTDSDTVLLGLRGTAIMAELSEMRPALFTCGVADLLINHATNKSTNPVSQKIKLLATTALGHLCLHPPCASHALKAGLLEHLVATASSAAWLGAARSVLGSGGDGDAQQLQLSRGLAAAFRGITGVPGGVAALRWSGAFSALRACVESSDVPTRLHGLQVCRAWSCDPENCRTFEKEGAVELVSAAAFASTVPEILLLGLETACHLAALAEATCRALVSGGASPACARAIATVQETIEAPEEQRQQSLALATAAVTLLELLTATSRLPVLDKIGDGDLMPSLVVLLASAHAGHGNEQLAGRAGLLIHQLCCGGCCGRKCKPYRDVGSCPHLHEDREWGSTANWKRMSACPGVEEVVRAWPRLQQCVCRMDIRMVPMVDDVGTHSSRSDLASQ